MKSAEKYKEGEQLQDAIKLSRLRVDEVLPALGVKRSTLFNYYKLEILDDGVKESAARLLGRSIESIFPKRKMDESPNGVMEDEILYNSSNWKDKYYASLERMQQKDEMLLKTSNAAIEAAQSATKLAEGLSHLPALLEKTADHEARLAALHGWLAESLSEPLQKVPSKILAELHIRYREHRGLNKEGKPVRSGKKSIEKASQK
jgi:hypothetical protein